MRNGAHRRPTYSPHLTGERLMQRIDVHKLADESRFNPFHGLVLFWGIMILVLDGYDLAVVGSALTALMKKLGAEATQAGCMASSPPVGKTYGVFIFGLLA